ncbi:hypothetical protein Nepgr_028685 [Nepenthes gracilis]|uniref:Uncharacterized protein n=1 Tax=Nepenthes gracilis TaxID=150966 RepID=A0AAD3TCI5_NEPGR|nr:hypothetical protein Nepgr_028685 [Nepenthes gracilis]
MRCSSPTAAVLSLSPSDLVVSGCVQVVFEQSAPVPKSHLHQINKRPSPISPIKPFASKPFSLRKTPPRKRHSTVPVILLLSLGFHVASMACSEAARIGHAVPHVTGFLSPLLSDNLVEFSASGFLRNCARSEGGVSACRKEGHDLQKRYTRRPSLD